VLLGGFVVHVGHSTTPMQSLSPTITTVVVVAPEVPDSRENAIPITNPTHPTGLNAESRITPSDVYEYADPTPGSVTVETKSLDPAAGPQWDLT